MQAAVRPGVSKPATSDSSEAPRLACDVDTREEGIPPSP